MKGLLILACIMGCSAPEGTRFAEHLGIVKTNVNLSDHSSGGVALDGVAPKNYETRGKLITAIETFTKEKKYVSAEKLAYEAAAAQPNDPELKVIHARTLLDLGRAPDAALILKTVDNGQRFESEIKFLTAITHLSTIQREQYRGQTSLRAFIDAARLLFEVSRLSPKFKDRFPPYTSVNDVRQSLVRYGERLNIDQLDISMLNKPKSIIALHDVLDKMQRSVIAAKLLKQAAEKWSKNKPILILSAKQYLTQNQPEKGLEFLSKAEPVEDLNTEELLTYAAGQIAASKQLDSDPMVRLIKSYHALITAESLKENSVFSTLIPRVKKTIISMLPDKIEPNNTLTLTKAERASMEILMKAIQSN